MGRTALKITLAVAMAAGLLLGVSGCGKSAETEKQAPAFKAGAEKVLRVGGRLPRGKRRLSRYHKPTPPSCYSPLRWHPSISCCFPGRIYRPR